MTYYTNKHHTLLYFARKRVPVIIGNNEELNLEEQLSELGRVVDDAARNLLNLTIGTSTTITHANALLVIFILSAVIFAIFSLTYLAASSVFPGYLNIGFCLLHVLFTRRHNNFQIPLTQKLTDYFTYQTYRYLSSITVYSHSQVIGMIHHDCRVGKVNVFFSNAFL